MHTVLSEDSTPAKCISGSYSNAFIPFQFSKIAEKAKQNKEVKLQGRLDKTVSCLYISICI